MNSISSEEPKEALRTMLSYIHTIAKNYGEGYRLHLRYAKDIPAIALDAKCDCTKTISTTLIANAFVYAIYTRVGMPNVMRNSVNYTYPGKGIVHTFGYLARHSDSKAANANVAKVNEMLQIYSLYPPSSIYVMIRDGIVSYLNACRNTDTPVFADKERTIYSSVSKNKIIRFIAKMFELATSNTPADQQPSFTELVDAFFESTHKQEKEMTTPKKNKVVKKEVSKESEVSKKFADADFLQVFMETADKGKEHWETVLKPALEEKKEPLKLQLSQLTQVILDAEAQSKSIAEQIEKINKLITKLADFFDK